MMNALMTNANLNTMVALDVTKCNTIVDLAWEEDVAKGDDIISQGSDEADYFYIVKDGLFEILINDDPDSKAGTVENVGTIKTGGSFGELALLYAAPRAATVKAKSDAVVWVMDRISFKRILVESGDKNAKEYAKMLDKNDLFSSLKGDEKLEVAKNLTEATFNKGETIFEQGDHGSTFFILYDGRVSVLVNGKEVAKPKGTKKNAAIFGELALLSDASRSATIKVLSDVAKTLCMDKESFDLLLGPLEDIKKRGATGESKVGVYGAGKAFVREVGREKLFRKDLTRFGLLGCGGFGAVELVEHNRTKDTYALKAMSKGYIVKCGLTRAIYTEKSITATCDSPWIIKLLETYNGDQSVYFLLEIALGGELFSTYSKKGFHGSSKHAKFYIGGCLFALEHLHKHKIIYRDLKPENILLSEAGYIKVTDMGLAKVVVGKTYTTCGTPDYFAPEMIASQGHTCAVDWWALGVLTFELMAGHPPFESAAPMQIYSRVTKGIGKIPFPSKLVGPGEDLIKQICRKEPASRLPLKKGGADNIKQHEWYKGFKWDKLADGSMEVPYPPKVKSKKDIGNFSCRKEDMPPQVKHKDDGTGWDNGFATST